MDSDVGIDVDLAEIADVVGAHPTLARAMVNGGVFPNAWYVNERGDTFAFGNPFSRARARQSTPLRPRTIGVGVSRTF